jgi:hypothetical protein
MRVAREWVDACQNEVVGWCGAYCVLKGSIAVTIIFKKEI